MHYRKFVFLLRLASECPATEIVSTHREK